MALGRRYFTYGSAAVASPSKTLVSVYQPASPVCRPFIYDMLLGSSATPGDNALLWELRRYTVDGTGTAFTPNPVDSGDPACNALSKQTYTAEPTYTANSYLFWLALNQRASHRWIADPNGPLILPNTAANGFGLYVVHSTFTGNADAGIYFAE